MTTGNRISKYYYGVHSSKVECENTGSDLETHLNMSSGNRGILQVFRRAVKKAKNFKLFTKRWVRVQCQAFGNTMSICDKLAMFDALNL